MSQNEPKINPATGYVHYEEPERPAPTRDPDDEVVEDASTAELGEQEASE